MLRACPKRAPLAARVSILPLVLIGLAIQATAATPNLAALLRPGGVRAVQLSPSGSRVAAIVQGEQSDSDLLVLEERQGKLTTLLSTHLDSADGIAGYRWLSDDYLAIYYAGDNDEFAQFGLLDIPHHALHVQDPFTQIIKAPWGDDTHMLLSATGAANCRSHTVARCLLTMDIRSGNSIRFSDPFTQVPVSFLAVSASEIYASGRDGAGHAHDYQLDVSSREWKPVADGTLQRRQQELQDAPPPAEVLQQQAHAAMPAALPVWTEPDHRLVGLLGLAPQRAFLALDSRLDGVQALLEQKYPEARVQMSGLNADLTRGMITIAGPDQPPLYVFFTATGSLTQYAQLEPDFNPSVLGRTHMERSWVDGMPVAITLPPQGITPVGAVIEPVIAMAPQAEEPLSQYDGLVQALSESGLVVVRPLIVIPSSFDTPADGGVWRQLQGDRLHMLMSHVRAALVPGKAVCLYGENLAGTLALAWSGTTQADCTVTVGARLDPAAYTHPIIIIRTQQGARAIRHGRMFVPAPPGQVTMRASDQQLHRDLPAQFAVAGTGQLVEPTHWAAQLPTRLMLAYDMQLRAQQEFASESGAFRRAAQRAGRQVDFYASESVAIDDIQSRDRMLQAVIDYLHRAMMTLPAAATAGTAGAARSP